jgi:hypothetical protein
MLGNISANSECDRTGYMIFKVLMAASMKIIAFWDIVLCSLMVD